MEDIKTIFEELNSVLSIGGMMAKKIEDDEEFIHDLERFYDERGFLSKGQLSRLTEIYDKI